MSAERPNLKAVDSQEEKLLEEKQDQSLMAMLGESKHVSLA